MKVTAINEFQRKKDNKTYWRVSFEGDEIPLLTFSKPEYSEGIDIPKENLTLSGDGKYYTMPTKKGGETTRKSYGKSLEEIAITEANTTDRCNKMTTKDIYVHCTESGTPFDTELWDKIHKKVANTSNANAIVEEIKSKYGGKVIEP